MRRISIALALTTTATLSIAACGGNDSTSSSSGVCPTNLVIQTDWWPEIEHGGTYQLVGAGGSVDASNFTYSGPIDPRYAVGGIETVEIRAGGDAISFQPVSLVLKTDPAVTLGFVNTDQAIARSAKARVTAVASTLDVNPQFLMWDPTQVDIDPTDPTSIASSGARILHFPNMAYIAWMMQKGFMSPDQSDPNYKGAPDQWIANGGDFVQQGFVTNEKFKYENLIEWKDGKPAPIDYVLVHDLGWQPYPAAYSVLTDRLDELSPCLTLLVPRLQQAWVDFLKSPSATSDVIVNVAKGYNNYWTVTPELNAAAIDLFSTLGIAANGADSTYGNFDLDRIATQFDEATSLFASQNLEIDPTLTADNSVTNEFIDPSIGLQD